jgi:hypothetical protein
MCENYYLDGSLTVGVGLSLNGYRSSVHALGRGAGVSTQDPGSNFVSKALLFMLVLKSNQQSKKKEINSESWYRYFYTYFNTNLHTITNKVFLLPYKNFKRKDTATILTNFNSFLDVLGQKSNFRMALSFGKRTKR